MDIAPIYKASLVLTAQPEGGYTVTSPVLPELITEGDPVEEALAHAQDPLAVVSELYKDLGKPIAAAFCEDRGDDDQVAGAVVSGGPLQWNGDLLAAISAGFLASLIPSQKASSPGSPPATHLRVSNDAPISGLV
jgi:antitoxin HicB